MTIELMLLEAMMIERRRGVESALRHQRYSASRTMVADRRRRKLQGLLRHLARLGPRRGSTQRGLHAYPSSG